MISALLLLSATTTSMPDRAGELLAERDFAFNAYQSCLKKNVKRIIPLQPNENAETIVSVSEHYCSAEWGLLDIAIHVEAVYSGVNPEAVSREWRHSSHNELLAFVLEYRVPATSPKNDPDSPAPM